MSNTKQLQKQMIDRILEGNGKAFPTQRRAAFNNVGLSKPLSILIDKVARFSYKVSDDDIKTVKKNGITEDQIFELVICAATGQASRQYDTGMGALNEAIKKGRDKNEA